MRPRMEDASIAFVLLTWNSKQYIKACLDSILKLSFHKISVYIVDNGSVDGTFELIKSMLLTDGRITLISLKKNEGTTKTRNMALRLVPKNTDYICILDSDTEVNDEAFNVLVEKLVLDRDETIGIIGPQMHNMRGEQQFSGRNLSTAVIKLCKAIPVERIRRYGANLEIPESQFKNNLQDVGYLLSACWLMPYTTLNRVGLLDEKIFYAPEDLDYCARIHELGLRVVFCNSANIMHDYQRISQKKLISLINLKHIYGLIYYFIKHGYLFNSSKVFQISK